MNTPHFLYGCRIPQDVFIPEYRTFYGVVMNSITMDESVLDVNFYDDEIILHCSVNYDSSDSIFNINDLKEDYITSEKIEDGYIVVIDKKGKEIGERFLLNNWRITEYFDETMENGLVINYKIRLNKYDY